MYFSRMYKSVYDMHIFKNLEIQKSSCNIYGYFLETNICNLDTRYSASTNMMQMEPKASHLHYYILLDTTLNYVRKQLIVNKHQQGKPTQYIREEWKIGSHIPFSEHNHTPKHTFSSEKFIEKPNPYFGVIRNIYI